MKVNLDYYKESEDLKQIGEEYEEVLQKVENCTREDFSKTLDSKSKIKNVIALSDVRENILNWYEFKKDCTILELNANYGEITGLLCKNAKKVVSIEASKKYADIIEKRHKNKENLEIIVGNYENIELQEKFDYIVIIGIVENLRQLIEYSKKYLKDDGTILLAVNNRFGVKAWITMNEDANIINNQKQAVSREQLENILQGMNYKYYYPLPDYKLPNIIYTDNSMPTTANIYRDLTYKDENINFKEVDTYYQIITNNKEDFKKFANSFLLEISKKEIKENDIKFISFSNIRKDEYRIKTIIRNKQVVKTAVNEKAIKHIEKVKNNIETLEKLGIKTLDTYEDGKIISKYVEAETLEDKLIKICKEQGTEELIKQIEGYKEFLKEKLQVTKDLEKNIFTKYKVECKEEILNKLTFVKYGLWDLIFQNCFMIDNEWYFYDQEWQEENVPVEYILYRAILYFHESKKYILDEEVFEKLNISEFIHIFNELDNKIQEKIRKPLVWNLHSKEELEKNKYAKARKELKQKELEIEQLKREIESLKNENDRTNNELIVVKNSLSWKITEPLRKIRSITNKNK